MEQEYAKGPFVISTERARLDVPLIRNFLASSYWAGGIPLAVVQKSIENSLCFGVYDGAAQVGFARVITDYATYGYLGDVFILDTHRGKGLAKWLMESVMAHPDLQGLRRWGLATRDAHSLYAQFGFAPLAAPENTMEISYPGIYLRSEQDAQA